MQACTCTCTLNKRFKLWPLDNNYVAFIAVFAGRLVVQLYEFNSLKQQKGGASNSVLVGRAAYKSYLILQRRIWGGES